MSVMALSGVKITEARCGKKHFVVMSRASYRKILRLLIEANIDRAALRMRDREIEKLQAEVRSLEGKAK